MHDSKPVVLFDIDYTLFDTDFFKQSGLSERKVYGEVMLVLEGLTNFSTLGIFSEGRSDFQKAKLEETGIAKFFRKENIHIFDDKDMNLTQVIDEYKGSKIFLVDDKLETLYSAKKHLAQVFTVWVKRGMYAERQRGISGFSPDATVENLSEVVRIVKQEMSS